MLSKKVHTMASPAVRSVNKSRDIKNAYETSHVYEICVMFTMCLYNKALKIDFAWSDKYG